MCKDVHLSRGLNLAIDELTNLVTGMDSFNIDELIRTNPNIDLVGESSASRSITYKGYNLTLYMGSGHCDSICVCLCIPVPKVKRFTIQASDCDGMWTKENFIYPYDPKDYNDNPYEFLYALDEVSDEVMKLEVGQRMFVKTNRDEKDSLGILTRTA